MKHSCWTRSSRSLTFAANTLLYVYSIYPLSKGEYLGGFQFFVIKKNDAMHILIHNLVYVSSGVYLAVVKSTSQHSVQISHSVVSDSLRPHGLQHSRFPCPPLAQTPVHWISGAIQPSHPLSSPSPPVFNLSQNQGLFQWVSSSHQVAKILELQLQHQSFQWIFRVDFL